MIVLLSCFCLLYMNEILSYKKKTMKYTHQNQNPYICIPTPQMLDMNLSWSSRRRMARQALSTVGAAPSHQACVGALGTSLGLQQE